MSPLSNFKYSRWRPIWLPRRKFLLFGFFSATDQPCVGQYACFGFNGWNRKGLRRIVSTVAMVTSNGPFHGIRFVSDRTFTDYFPS